MSSMSSKSSSNLLDEPGRKPLSLFSFRNCFPVSGLISSFFFFSSFLFLSSPFLRSSFFFSPKIFIQTLLSVPISFSLPVIIFTWYGITERTNQTWYGIMIWYHGMVSWYGITERANQTVIGWNIVWKNLQKSGSTSRPSLEIITESDRNDVLDLWGYYKKTDACNGIVDKKKSGRKEWRVEEDGNGKLILKLNFYLFLFFI